MDKVKYFFMSCILLFSLAFADEQTTTVTLQAVQTSPTNYAAGLNVSIAGGPPSLLMFDTGSTGITVFASQVNNSNIRYTTIQKNSSYGPPGNSYTLHGVIAYAPVTIGNLTTPAIPILVIKSVTCNGQRNCLGSADGEPPMFHRFYGIFGASLGPNTVNHLLVNPLLYLPGNYGNGYIIQNLGPQQNGQLVLGLTSQNSMGFNEISLPKLGKMSNGKNFYKDKALKVEFTLAGTTLSLPTYFDTAANSNVTIFASWPGVNTTPTGLITDNLPFEAKLGNVFDWQFTTGLQHGVNTVRIAPTVSNGFQHFNMGTLFYYYYDALYDPINGTLGFKPQSQS